MPGSYTQQISRKFTAGENLAAYRVVVTGAGPVVNLADAGDIHPVGTTGIDGAVAKGAAVDVTLWNAPGTRLVTAGGIITAGAAVALAANGKIVAATSETEYYGIALEAAAGDGAVIEVLPIAGMAAVPSGS